MSEPKPPAQIAVFVEILGVDEAIRFLLHFGGAELYLATTPKGRSELAREFGLDNATRIASLADRLPRRIPLAKEWIAAVWKDRGWTDANIARNLHVTDVTVRKWRNKAPWRGIRRRGEAREPDDRQLPLI